MQSVQTRNLKRKPIRAEARIEPKNNPGKAKIIHKKERKRKEMPGSVRRADQFRSSPKELVSYLQAGREKRMLLKKKGIAYKEG